MSQGGEYQREWGLANGGEFFAQRGENLCIGGRGVGGWVGGDNQSLLSHHPDQPNDTNICASFQSCLSVVSVSASLEWVLTTLLCSYSNYI